MNCNAEISTALCGIRTDTPGTGEEVLAKSGDFLWPNFLLSSERVKTTFLFDNRIITSESFSKRNIVFCLWVNTATFFVV